MKKLFAVTAVLALLAMCAGVQATVNIQTVAIGAPGNAADTRVGYGSAGFGAVSYNYNIGKYEVTSAQYCEFLNAKAATDTYGLYNSSMSAAAAYGCGIELSGSSGSYTYNVASGYANRPVSKVSWYDAIRFVNWLTNGQGSGDTESGSYTITNGGVNSGTVSIPAHTAGPTARWFLPSENEWYKAAYYRNGVYSLYANGTNTAPVAGTGSNYNLVVGHTWDGSANGALEQNGTKDMMGNVWEWNELISGSFRGQRGGSFYYGYDYLQSTNRYGYYPNYEDSGFGFRVSEIGPVPEPSSILALAGGLLSLFGLRRRKA